MVKYGKMNAAYSMITYHNPHLQVPLQLARQRKPATHVDIGVDVDPGAAQMCIGTSICDSERLGRIQCTQKEHGWLFGRCHFLVLPLFSSHLFGVFDVHSAELYGSGITQFCGSSACVARRSQFFTAWPTPNNLLCLPQVVWIPGQRSPRKEWNKFEHG